MNTKPKTWIAAAVVAMLSVGTVSAHPGPGFPGDQTFADVCPDDITVGECKENLQQYRADLILERCAEKYDEEFCQALLELRTEQKAETAALFEENGYNQTPHPFRPDRDDLVGPRDVCDGNTTINDCREAVKEANQAVRLAACAALYDEDFCLELLDLKKEHKAELEELFDEYGYDKPDKQDRKKVRDFLDRWKVRWGRN